MEQWTMQLQDLIYHYLLKKHCHIGDVTTFSYGGGHQDRGGTGAQNTPWF